MNEQKLYDLVDAIGSLGDHLILESADGSRETREQNLTKWATVAAAFVFTVLAVVLIALQSHTALTQPGSTPGATTPSGEHAAGEVPDFVSEYSITLYPAGFRDNIHRPVPAVAAANTPDTNGEGGVITSDPVDDNEPDSLGVFSGFYASVIEIESVEDLSLIKKKIFRPDEDGGYIDMQTKKYDDAFFSENMLCLIPVTVWEMHGSVPSLSFSTNGSTLVIGFDYPQNNAGDEFLDYFALIAVRKASAPEGMTVSCEYTGGQIFDAVVSEDHGTTLVVDVTDGLTSSFTSGEKITIPRKDDATGCTIPDEITVGDTLRITYAGLVMEVYPAMLENILDVDYCIEPKDGKVFSVYTSYTDTIIDPNDFYDFCRGSLNYPLVMIDERRYPLPVFAIKSEAELHEFRERAAAAGLSLDYEYDVFPSFDSVAMKYNDELFSRGTLYIIYVDEPRSSGIEYSLSSVSLDNDVLNVELDCAVPGNYTDDEAGWFISFFRYETSPASDAVVKVHESEG